MEKKNYRPLRKGKRLVKIESHGCAYFIIGDGYLGGHPLNKDGSIDRGTSFQVEEAPKSYKKGHLEALRRLGVKDAKKYIRKIDYY